MYKQFFGLRENPFNVNPDPRYLFLTSQTQAALTEMAYGIQARKGLILLTGEVGTGKTTLINRLLDSLHEQRTPTAFIFNSHLETNHLFDFILSDFGVPFDPQLKGNPLQPLNHWLIERYREGSTPVLIVDEAQGLPTHVLEEIRLLLNLETPREKLLQIVLSGQPELENRLEMPELRQIKQRITLRCKTAALTLEETHDYIQARLRIAGANGKPIFASQAMDAVHFYSRGIPRVTNLLCEHALITAYADNIQPVPAHIVADVAREFQFDDIEPEGPTLDPTEALRSYLDALQLALASPLGHPSVMAEPLLSQEEDGASTASISGPFVVAATVPDSSNETAMPVQYCDTDAGLNEEKETVSALGVMLSAPAASGQIGKELRHSSASAPHVSVADNELLNELAMKQASLAHPPLLHVVEGRGKFDPLLAASRRRVPSPHKPVYAPAVKAKRSTRLASRGMTHPGLRISLIIWTARWRDRILSAVAWPAWIQISVTLLRRLKWPLHSVKGLYKRWPVWRELCRSAVGSLELPKMKTWLQQPLKPIQWRLPHSRQLEAGRRLIHKKM